MNKTHENYKLIYIRRYNYSIIQSFRYLYRMYRYDGDEKGMELLEDQSGEK